jgi:very-short-patch-repair endonuclease
VQILPCAATIGTENRSSFRIQRERHPLPVVRPIDHDRWATDHHGLISRDACGVSRSRWHRAVATGLVEPLHPGLARLPGTARSREQAIMAAVLAAGPGAMASHRSAAHLWGIERPTGDPIDIIMPGRRRQPRVAGVVVHRPSDRGRLTPQRRDGIPCTNILRTLLDLGAVDRSSVAAALRTSLSARLTPIEAVEVVLHEHARPGRAGVRALRSAVIEASLDRKPVDSVLEPAMHRLAARHRLPSLEFHPRLEGWEVDFRIVGTAILLECDGWTSHGLDRKQFERDRVKDDDLRGAGWIVHRFTYRVVVERPGDTARRIRRAIDRWGVLVPPDLAA